MIKCSFRNIKKFVSNGLAVEILYKYNNKKHKVIAQCEWLSISGSIKDRVAYQIYFDAFRSNKLKSGDKVVEVTSGNMGISLACIGALLGLDITIIMPKNMSIERQQLLRLYGAKVVLTKDFEQAFKLCDKYVKQGYFCCNQFANKNNTKVHSKLTATELLNHIKNKRIKCFVAGVGTSGTLTGAGKMLKKYNYKIVGIEPENARILSCKKPYKHHLLQGLSDQRQPALYNIKIVDQIIQINDWDAIAMAQKLSKELGLGVGISSAANFLGCVITGKNCATVFADDNKKYLSTELSKPVKTNLVDQITLLNLKILL